MKKHQRINTNRFSKVIAALLAFVMIGSLSVNAFAAESGADDAQYAVLFESADGSKSVYCKTMAEATKLAANDGDTITLLRDVQLGESDYTGSNYRMELKKGVTIDLNGKVLSSDKSIMRLLNSDTNTVAKVTFKNGTLVSAEEGTSQHMLVTMNHGALVLENVEAYCGAYYENGQIVVNTEEVNASSGGVSAVLMACGDRDVEITNSKLVTYGNYSVINTNNTNANLPKGDILLKNTRLQTSGSKTVFGGSDKRDYTVRFLDEKSVLTTKLATDGAFNTYAKPDHYLGFTDFEVTAAGSLYNYAYPAGDYVLLETIGEGTATVGGENYAQVGAWEEVQIAVSAAKGWYVNSAVDSNGNTLTVEDGTINYTHTGGMVTVTVEFKQYAAMYQDVNGKGTYHKTLKAAVAKVTNDRDKITLLRDVTLDANDNFGSSSGYRLNIQQGFILDLNGHVLYADNSLLRLCYSDTENKTTMTIQNGTLVSGEAGSSKHMLVFYNHGGLVLENVDAYCGALYENGRIVINTAETAKSDGVNAVLMSSGDGTVKIKDSLLCTYGNYNVINTYNTTENLPQSVFTIENSHLITYGEKTVFGASDRRNYTVNFTDNKSVLTTKLADGGAFHACVQPVYAGNYGFALFDSVVTEGVTLYNYTTVSAHTVIWANYDGTVLETDRNMMTGMQPQYNGQIPQRETDEHNAYIFSGWTPKVDAVEGDVTYTATFKAVDPAYQQTGIDLINERDLYRTQGRPYMTAEGLHLDFAGAAIEFEAELGGMLTMNISTEKELYFQLYVDGVADENRIHVLTCDDQTVMLTDYVEPGRHTIRLVRDSDVYRNGETMTISSINFIGVKSTVKATEQRPLLIEFVGDSITSGKYTEMQHVEGEAIHKATNSYAYKTAQLLNADYSMISRGGCGYFRVSSCRLPAHKIYPYYNGFADAPVEYTTDRKADVVVLALGTNDSAASVPESFANGIVPFETFIEAPRYVIGQIRGIHGDDVKIVLLHNMMTGSWEEELRTVAQLEDVYFLKVTQNRDGGSNHPASEGHTLIAQELAAFLQETVLPEVYVCDGESRIRYGSLQKAVDAVTEGQYICLNGDITEDVELPGDVYLDLNGHTLTGSVTGTGTLYGMDCATDDYAAGGRITGTVSCKVEQHFKDAKTLKRYMAVADETGYTFNRFYVGVTRLNLRPDADGVGYKATIAGNDAVLGQIKNYGYKLWLTDGKTAVATKDGASLENMNTVTARVENFDVENYGETPINGSVFIELQDGTVIESTAVTFTFRDMVETISANADTYTESQLSAVKAMVSRFADAMANWDIDSLR